MSTLKLVCFILYISNLTLTLNVVVKVRLGEATMADLSYNKYPVHFSQHRGTTFSSIRKSQWLYGVLREKVSGSKWIYSIELPQIGRMIYTNPDSEHPVILDQVEYHHPCFVWNHTSYRDLKGETTGSLLKNLKEKEFMYQTLIGDVTLEMDIRDVSESKNIEYVRALQFNAPRKKVIREILRYKNIL
jgi:hypothetical protein